MAVATDLYRGPDLVFAELFVPADDPDWGEHNLMTQTIVALPATPVWQVHDGQDRQLFNQNHVVVHRAGMEYHRERFGDSAYRCLFLVPSPSLLRDIAGEIDPACGGDGDEPLGDRSGPLDVRTFLLSRLAAGRLRSATTDHRAMREILYELVLGAVAATKVRRSRPPMTEATRRARQGMVEGAKEQLTARMETGVSLDGLARSLYTSPFHLSRVFRSATGYSVHGYLTQLRLRFGLDRIPEGPGGIGRLGVRLGFSSHSHFTASFHRAFGLTPSALIGPLRGFEPSTISTT